MRFLLFPQASDLLSSGPPPSAAVSTNRKQQRSIRDFFTSPPTLPSPKRLKTQPPAQHASAASHSEQHARTDQNLGRAASAAQGTAFNASAARDSAAFASAARDSAASASAGQRLLGRVSAAEFSGEQHPAEQSGGRQSLVRQTGISQAALTSTRPVLVNTQQASVLHEGSRAAAEGFHTDLHGQQRQEGPVLPLGEQSQQLHDSGRALATQQGQPAFRAAAVAAGQHTKSMFCSPAGSDGNKENMCHLEAAGPVTA